MTDNNQHTTFPSQPVTFIDIPEVKNFTAEFVYNFFVADERVNDQGLQIDNTDDAIVRRFEQKAPRYTKFRFSPVKLKYPASTQQTNNEFREGTNALREQAVIQNNLSRIVAEQSVTTTDYVGLRFQDTQIDDKLYTLVSGTLNRKIDNHNRRIENQFNATAQSINNTLNRSDITLFDVAKLMSIGHGEREAQVIVNSLNQLKRLNARFIDEDARKEKVDMRFERIKRAGLDVQVSSKFIHTLLTSAKQDPIGLYLDELRDALSTAMLEQKRAVAKYDASSIDMSEFEFTVDPVCVRRIDTALFKSRRRIAGYIIDKYEVARDGRLIPREPIIVEDGNTSTALDADIKYGVRYVYTIRTIVNVEFVATVDEQDEIYAASVLMSSKPSTRAVIDTVENVPPPAPVDFNVTWDNDSMTPLLVWSFPVNRQRDIKKFQVFKRAGINEPFMLVKQYDFDDSVVKTVSREVVHPLLNETLQSPRSYYRDFDYVRSNSEVIYAVCAIDAHGLTSNYSTQFAVSYDSSRRRLVKRLISQAGAPKQYPNMYLNKDDVIVDVVRDSGHSGFDIYFDPGYFDVTTGDGNHYGIFTFGSKNGRYKFQLINADLQRGTSVDIVLDDRRTPPRPTNKTLKTEKRPRQRITCA